MKKVNDSLSDYVLHFNRYTLIWAAIPRSKERIYWNENKETHDKHGILYSNSIDSLIMLLNGNLKREKLW